VLWTHRPLHARPLAATSKHPSLEREARRSLLVSLTLPLALFNSNMSYAIDDRSVFPVRVSDTQTDAEGPVTRGVHSIWRSPFSFLRKLLDRILMQLKNAFYGSISRNTTKVSGS